jgi:hypothetical protein
MATYVYDPTDVTLVPLSEACIGAFGANFTAANILVLPPALRSLYVNFTVALTAPEIVTLDGLVAANKAAFVAPVVLPGSPYYGVPLPFGCDQPLAGAGEYYVVNGDPDRTNWPTLDDRTQIAVPVEGYITRFAWSSESADATTVIKILVAGLVVKTFNLTGLSGVVVFDEQLPVLAGQLVAVEYDAGLAPDESNVTVYVEPASL